MVSTIALIVLCALVLILLLLVIFMRNDICAMKDLCERMRDEIAKTSNICSKLDVAITWLIEEKGVTLEQASYWSNSWYIAPLKDKWHIKGLNDAWAAIYPHREAIAQALLDALTQWDKEREAKWESKKKGCKK